MNSSIFYHYTFIHGHCGLQLYKANNAAHPSVVGSAFGVRRLGDELVDPIEVVGHSLAPGDVGHVGGRGVHLLRPRDQRPDDPDSVVRALDAHSIYLVQESGQDNNALLLQDFLRSFRSLRGKGKKSG